VIVPGGRPRRPASPSLARRLAVAAFGFVVAAEAIVAGAAFAAPSRAVSGTSARTVTRPTAAAEVSTADETPISADLDLGLLAKASPSDPFAGSAVEPGIQYEDAMAHANDRIAFAPGGRVTVPFRPRADDGWAVGGGRPVALPAGRLTGRQMAAGGASPAPAATTSVATADADPAAFVAPVATEVDDPAATAGMRRQIFGFLPYWEVGNSSTVLNYSLLSTIAYFSVGANKYGYLLKKNADGSTTTGWGGWTSSRMTSVINAAHTAGTRVVLTLSVFAWSSSQASVQASILGNATYRLRLAQQAAAAVRDRGADGINLDFEPIASGYGDEFVAFVRTLRSELNKIKAGYQLTFDTTGFVGNYQVSQLTAAGAADAMFLMGYDFRTSGSSPVGSIAPLAGPAYDINDSLKTFLSKVPASKIILGVPYYGRAWSTTSSALDAKNQSGTKYGSSVSVNYENAVDVLGQYGRHYDSLEQVAWTAYQKQNCTSTYGCVTSWRELYVDDGTALRAKYDVVNRLGLRGVGMWALGYDGTRPELYKALSDKFLRDTTLPQAGIKVLPAAAGDEGFVVSWTGSDDVGVTDYDVQVATDGGVWTAWQTGTTATSAVWLGTTGHTYGFRVRARDTSGNWSAWNVAQTGTGTPTLARGSFGVVAADGLSLRAAPDTSASRLGTANSGDVFAITGGPISADGYTWYMVTGPLSEWSPVGTEQMGIWLAASGSGSTLVAARRAPNATGVAARLSALTFAGLGSVSLGPISANRMFSPNGDGHRDTLRLAWTNSTALDTLSLRVLRTDGTLAGAVDLSGHRAAGGQAFDWDGRAGGSVLPDAHYVLQLVATAGGATFTAPSARPVTTEQIARYAVAIDRLADASFTPLGPTRVIDTRSSIGLAGAFANRSARTFQLAGRAGIPSDALAASVNVTVTGATSNGYLAITRTATNSPTTSTLNVPRGDTRANGITVPLDSAGRIGIVWVGASGSHAQVVLDVTGWTR
jgi:spore germination protein YaaH